MPSVSTNSVHPILNVYIENSGSMNGYMVDKSELKDAVYSYVSALDTYASKTNLFFINSTIIPRQTSIKSFVYNLTPATFKSAGGSTAHSDIADMFEQILSRSNDTTVSIFVSDCILDVPNGDATDFFNLKETQITNAFRKYFNTHPKFGVEVLRMESLFDGICYSQSGSEKLDTIRPYFMIIMGDKELLAVLNKKFPFAKEIKHGYKNYAAFTSTSEVPYTITNEMGVSNNKNGKNEVIASHNTFLIKADLLNTLQTSEVLGTVENYKSSSNCVELASVSEIEDDDDYTSLLKMQIKSVTAPTVVQLHFVQPLAPKWISEYNDDSGKDIKKNIEKTTGIKYIIQGIANAFKNEKPLDINFVINKK